MRAEPFWHIRAGLIQHDCTDGFFGAYWRRPGAYLDPDVRLRFRASPVSTEVTVRPAIERLAADPASGAWDRRNPHLRALEEIDLGYRLVVSTSA